ncbi:MULTISPECIES: hypothetical protein [unclassified Saccharicrinis]|uniref:hypothetical protein n=1 Tax=unclassified Saccharicrinis TaxID=2646859 RepID=UPI003D33321A
MLKIKTISIAILTSWISISSQTKLESDFKSYSLEVFPLHDIKKLDVRAKHAQVNLLNWDKDSISVETSIEILSNKPNISKEMLEEIKIETVEYSNVLLIKTSLVDDFNRTIPYQIEYTIFYPKKLELRIENNHGRVDIDHVEGGVLADISYCDINFKNFSQDTGAIINHINLLHCKGKMNHLGSANIEFKNSTVNIQDATEIHASTSYCLLNIDHVKNYQANSTVDNIKIGACDNVSMFSENSVIQINKFKHKALFECSKGILNISNPELNFRELTINNDGTPTTVVLNSDANYIINGDVSNGKFIHKHRDQLKIIKDQDKISFNGVVGNNPNPNTKIIIFNKNQKVKFN